MSLCKVRLKHFPNAGVAMPSCPGWTRKHRLYKKHNVVAQLFENKQLDVQQVDVFSLLPNTPITVDVLGEERVIWPLSGYGMTIGKTIIGDVVAAETDGDNYYSKKLNDPWPDVAFAGTAGSPRNEFRPRAYTWMQMAGGVSPTMAAYFEAFAKAQVERPVQDVTAMGLPRALIEGKATFPSMCPPALDGNPNGISPYWTHHLTIDVLCDIYLLTGSPRALDQLTRVILHALLTQDVYSLKEYNEYGRVARVAGWWLHALARALQVYTHAGLIPLRDYLLGVARGHLAKVDALWQKYGDWTWTPAKTLPYTASSVFHIATLIEGCRSLKELGIIQAREPYLRGVQWMETHGWNHESDPAKLVIYYDAAQDPTLNTVAGLFGTGVWPWPGLEGSGSDLADAIGNWAKETNYGDAPFDEWIRFFGSGVK